MPLGGLLTVGLIGAGVSAGTGIAGAEAAGSAADQQAKAASDALAFQKGIYQDTVNNQAPFVSAGQSSIKAIMDATTAGKFGPGSLPAVPNAPTYNVPAFQAPTLEQAQNSPGYQFQQQQGLKALAQSAAASSGQVSGGAMKAIAGYETGLNDSTYNDVFNRALATHSTALQDYNSQLAGYGATISGLQEQGAQQQEGFNQLAAPAGIGQGAIQNVNAIGQNTAVNVGQLMTQIGNAGAAGTVGATNALTAGATGASSSITQAMLLNSLLKGAPANNFSLTPEQLGWSPTGPG